MTRPKTKRKGELSSVAKQRKALKKAKLFVDGSIDKKGTRGVFCMDCAPNEVVENSGESFVDLWEEGSDGWVAAPICEICKLAIPVYVDGEEPFTQSQYEITSGDMAVACIDVLTISNNASDLDKTRSGLAAFFDSLKATRPPESRSLIDTTKARRILRVLADQSARHGWFRGDHGIPPERGATGEDAIDVTDNELRDNLTNEIDIALDSLLTSLGCPP